MARASRGASRSLDMPLNAACPTAVVLALDQVDDTEWDLVATWDLPLTVARVELQYRVNGGEWLTFSVDAAVTSPWNSFLNPETLGSFDDLVELRVLVQPGVGCSDLVSPIVSGNIV